MHKQKILIILFLPKLVNNPCRHRKSGNARRTDHGIYLFLCKQIDEFCKENAADRVKHECNKAKPQNKQRLRTQEFVRAHRGGNG